MAAPIETTVGDIVATLLDRLELNGGGAGGMHDVSFDCDGRDYELVWDSASDSSIEATLWDETDEDPVQIATLRFTVAVIA